MNVIGGKGEAQATAVACLLAAALLLVSTIAHAEGSHDKTVTSTTRQTKHGGTLTGTKTQYGENRTVREGTLTTANGRNFSARTRVVRDGEDGSAKRAKVQVQAGNRERTLRIRQRNNGAIVVRRHS